MDGHWTVATNYTMDDIQSVRRVCTHRLCNAGKREWLTLGQEPYADVLQNEKRQVILSIRGQKMSRSLSSLSYVVVCRNEIMSYHVNIRHCHSHIYIYIKILTFSFHFRPYRALVVCRNEELILQIQYTNTNTNTTTDTNTNTITDTNTNTGLIKLWWFAEMKS